MAMQAFEVLLDGEEIDIVFFVPDMTPEDVKRSLINHDSYDPRIEVRKEERYAYGLSRIPRYRWLPDEKLEG